MNSIESQLNEAKGRLLKGEVVGFPTETFYGLAADPFNQSAVEKLSELKNRGLGAGIPLILDDVKRLNWLCGSEKETADYDKRYRVLLERFWPGPLTVVVAVGNEIEENLAPLCFGPEKTLAVRVSSEPIAAALAASVRGLITATSANQKGGAPTTIAAEVRDIFPELFVIDRSSPSDNSIEKPSTIIDIRAWPYKMLREGAISSAEIDEIVCA